MNDEFYPKSNIKNIIILVNDFFSKFSIFVLNSSHYLKPMKVIKMYHWTVFNNFGYILVLWEGLYNL